MKKTKTKVILVKNSPQNQFKQVLGKVNKPVLVFVCTLFLGIGIAVGLGYLYSVYNDNIFATDDSIRDTLNYQGKIVNADGVPPPDGNYKMQFKIFNLLESSGTTGLLWTEVWNGSDQNTELGGTQGMLVPVSQGVFTVELNSLCSNWVGNCAFAGSGGVTFSQSSYYLQVELDYDGNGTFEEIFAPRKRFTSTPYSMNADKLDGKESADFVSKTGDHIMAGSLTAKGFIDSSVIAYYQFSDHPYNSSIYPNLDGSMQGSASLGSDILFLDGIDSHIMVNDNSLLSFGNGTIDSSFTFSAWINMNNLVNFPIISKGVYNTNAEYFFGTDIDGKLTVRIYDESVADSYIGKKYATSALLGGAWLHVAATYNGNGAATGLKLYLNGEVIDDAESSASCQATTCPYVAMENLASAMYLGKYDATYANGRVDEVKIQNRALTTAEVRSLYSTSRNKYLDVDEVTTLYLYLSGVDPVDQTNESGYLYFDPIFNQIRASSQMFIPDNFPASQDADYPQDYTHFADEHKILAYDFVNSTQGIIDVEGLHHGTPNGNALPINDGYYGYGYRFDNNGDYISLGYMDFPAVSAGSIEMWARFNDISNSQTNYLAYFFTGINASISLYKQGFTDLYVAVGDSGPVDTGYDISDNNWHHFALTWQANPSNSFQVYVDGVAQGTPDSFSSMTTPTDLAFGGRYTSDNSLNGSMDSVAIYDDVLTADEIVNHANSSFGTLYVNDKLKDGIIETTLGSLVTLPSTLSDNNVTDPALFGNIYGNNETKKIALSFSEGFGTETLSNLWDDSIPYTYAYATLYGPTWIKNGMFGNALSFDGVDDYLEVLDDFPTIPTDYDAFDNSADFDQNDFAIEFWINGSTLGNNEKRVISKRVGDVGYEIYYDSSTDSLLFFIGDGTNVVTSSPSGSHFSDGKWHHFMVSVDYGSTAAIYRDGNVWDMGSVNISSVTSSISNSANLLIGKDSTGNYFNGKIDSIVLHDLSSSTQFNIYDAYARAMKAPEGIFLIGKNTPGGQGTLSLINQSNSGDGAVLGMLNSNNTSGYPLALWTDNNNSDVYNLIYFGTTTMGGTGGQSDPYGSLKWNANLSQFEFDQNLYADGDMTATGTVSGSLLSGPMRVTGGSTPGSSCTAGDFTWDSGALYICTDTDNWETITYD